MSHGTVAVIGSGVAGLTAAHLLRRTHDVTLFEADDRLGGHAHTHQAGGTAVDTGFIVHNTRTYPLLCRLFEELGVQTRPTEMSLSVHCDECGLEFAGGRRGRGLLPRGSRRVWRNYALMLTEVPRFNNDARRFLRIGGEPGLSFGEFLARHDYSRYFVDHVALPLVATVWSAEENTGLAQPAGPLLDFLNNHALLSLVDRVRWRTVVGGSRNYVDRIAAELTTVRLATPVREVRRHADGVTLVDASGGVHEVDKVVIATHADQALALLADPTRAEREVLGAFRYTRNRVHLHSDASVLPAARRARASWNLRKRSCRGAGPITVTYDLNRLMRLDAVGDHLVTLNGSIDPDRVLASMRYEHPRIDQASEDARQRLPALTSATTAYAGAYHGSGFHEDGCAAGARAAAAFGAPRW
ncbi:NAD(P)/FAD-dependent oxidoreductase [Actinomadura scrupuli]|uniref:NAD(P)/FAD-dependent oxidoreductase n=1 Tax=Actinomadura scrupuli TaxID=559629 RepID=UPI003D988EDE